MSNSSFMGQNLIITTHNVQKAKFPPKSQAKISNGLFSITLVNMLLEKYHQIKKLSEIVFSPFSLFPWKCPGEVFSFFRPETDSSSALNRSMLSRKYSTSSFE